MGLNRIQPQGKPGDYQTYGIRRRPDVLRPAACKEVGCRAWARGWETKVDEATPLGRQQAAYIRTRSGRTFKEYQLGGITVFRFESGQRCFADHQTIAETFRVWGGDWRRNLGPIRQHKNGLDWAEDFGEHQQRLADEQERG